MSEEYVQEVFDDEQAPPKDLVLKAIISGPPILKTDVCWSLQQIKTGKAAGPDGIS